jgi:hypothetical protein
MGCQQLRDRRSMASLVLVEIATVEAAQLEVAMRARCCALVRADLPVRL